MSEKALFHYFTISLFHKSVLEGYDVSAWLGVSTQHEPKKLSKNLTSKGSLPSFFREKQRIKPNITDMQTALVKT